MATQTAAQNTPGLLTPREITAFCAQISLILQAGISMPEGVAIMCEDTEDKAGRAILQEVLDHVERGEPLFMALSAAQVFPKYMVDMVEIGEASGRLDQVMDSLCAYYERSENIAQSIKSAITYPLVMVVMMLLTVSVLVAKVLPIFRQVFQQLGSDMTGFSQQMLGFGTAMGNVALGILVALAVVAVVFAGLRLTSGGRVWISGFADRFFLTREITGRMATGKFASAMALMLSSGLDVDRSLEMAEKLVDNRRISNKIAVCKERIAGGSTFSDALSQAELFTGVNAKMVTVGVRSGAIDQVMRRIADRYEDEVNLKISNVISILEPTLVAVLSVVVGIILISVMLPLMGVMSSIG